MDLWAASVKARRLEFTHAWAAAGRHTIRVVVAGTRGHPRVDVDGFIVVR